SSLVFLAAVFFGAALASVASAFGAAAFLGAAALASVAALAGLAAFGAGASAETGASNFRLRERAFSSALVVMSTVPSHFAASLPPSPAIEVTRRTLST